jgi:hypothetical protein
MRIRSSSTAPQRAQPPEGVVAGRRQFLNCPKQDSTSMWNWCTPPVSIFSRKSPENPTHTSREQRMLLKQPWVTQTRMPDDERLSQVEHAVPRNGSAISKFQYMMSNSVSITSASSDFIPSDRNKPAILITSSIYSCTGLSTFVRIRCEGSIMSPIEVKISWPFLTPSAFFLSAPFDSSVENSHTPYDLYTIEIANFQLR